MAIPIKQDLDEVNYYCSNCDETSLSTLWNFCPECGEELHWDMVINEEDIKK